MQLVIYLNKAKERPVNSVSPNGKYYKNPQGKWVPIKKERSSKVDTKALIKDAQKYLIDKTGNKYEHMVAYDSKGKLIFEKAGNESEVSFTPEELKKLKGATVVHNHPGEPPFTLSVADITLAVTFGFERIVAVTDTTTYSYSGYNKSLRVLLQEKAQRELVKNYQNTDEKEINEWVGEYVYDAMENKCLKKATEWYKSIPELDDDVEDADWNLYDPQIQEATVCHMRMEEFAEQYGGKYATW